MHTYISDIKTYLEVGVGTLHETFVSRLAERWSFLHLGFVYVN